MKKNHLLATMKTCLLLSAGMFLASCAQDGFEKESFVGTYPGFQLTTPDASTVTVKASSDKQSQTITWDAINGAGTYTVNVFQGDTPDECTNVIAKDRVTKVNYVTVPRINKTYYRATIKVNDNIPEGNTAPAETTEVKWNTYTIEMGTIPAGSDINLYLKNNPIPVSYAATDITYRLEDGKEYYISDTLQLGNTIVTFRPVSETGRAKIKFNGKRAGFETSLGLTLREIDFDCAGSDAAFIAMSKKPAIEPIVVTAWGADYNFYCSTEPISVLNCNIDNLESFFFYDNKVSCWFPTTVLVDNCLVHLTSTKTSDMGTGGSTGYFWTNKGSGYIRDLTVKNSTFYNTGELDGKYFVQYGGFGWSQTQPSLGWDDNTITYDHCTFYHVCSDGQWGNYNGIAGKSTSYWNMTNCIFFDCSSSGVPRRFLAGKQNQATATFLNNTYQKKDGTFDTSGNVTSYDTSGSYIEEDPHFADPANGDFHISNSKQATLGTGDPRWLP